jgi:tetratricopeptide (TPR) repeat protein
VNEDANMQQALEQVVLHQVDAEKGEGKTLSEEYIVEGYPTFILVNADGQTIESWRGFGEVKGFTERLDGALRDPTTIEEKRQRFSQSPTMSDAEKLGDYHESREEFQEAVRYYREAQKYAAGTDRDFHYDIFDAVFYGSRSDLFTLDEVRTAADAVFDNEAHTPEQVMDVAYMMLLVGRKKDAVDSVLPYLNRALQETAGVQEEDLKEKRLDLEIESALLVDKDEAKAVSLKRSSMPAGWKEKADQLNAFAWWCFENKVNLEEADKLARKGVQLAEDDKTKAMILDTAAETCNARGDCKDAVRLTELAIEADPQSTYYPKQLERFRKLLAEKDGSQRTSGSD